MFSIPLQPKPDNARAQITCQIERADKLLHVSFVANCSDDIADVAASDRLGPFTDGLWQSTCFELFIAQTRSTNYLEWNFATDGRFAVYCFKDIRQRATDVESPSQKPLSFASTVAGAKVDLRFTLSLNNIHDMVGHPFWYIQPTAILRRTSGELTYWAPDHPGPAPDFHRFDHLPKIDPYAW